jgi:hypothetical protein
VSYCPELAEGRSLGPNERAKRAKQMLQMVNRTDAERLASVERSPGASPLDHPRTLARNHIFLSVMVDGNCTEVKLT